jgi:Matrixin
MKDHKERRMSKSPFALADVKDPFSLLDAEKAAKAKAVYTHRYASGKDKTLHVCRTDDFGHTTPHGQSDVELRVDTHMGFIPLWAKNSILRWRFNETAFSAFRSPEVAKQAVRQLMGLALKGWGDAVPVTFSEQRDLYDFEIVVLSQPDCDANGCVLASSFFPDGGRHQLNIYPTMFQQTQQEQVGTLEHEFGHVFGLRHWFANVAEAGMASTVFGKDSKISIMNYGEDSQLTTADKRDLKKSRLSP